MQSELCSTPLAPSQRIIKKRSFLQRHAVSLLLSAQLLTAPSSYAAAPIEYGLIAVLVATPIIILPYNLSIAIDGNGNVTIPSTTDIDGVVYTVTGLQDNALSQAPNVSSLHIPASLTNADAFSFLQSGLTSITVEAGNPSFSSKDGVLYSADSSKLIYYPNGKGGQHFEIPDTVTEIGPNAFFSEITLGEYDPLIAPAALTRISIPDSVTRIGSFSFATLRNLTSITLPDNITDIGAHAFAECTSLESIELPAGLARIPDGMFSLCSSLSDIKFPDSLTVIGYAAFENCGFSIFKIPNGVTHIEQAAFNGCSNLTRVIIPESVTDFGKAIFLWCPNLQDVYFAGAPPSITGTSGSIFPALSNTVYYSSLASGWGATYQGRPAVPVPTVTTTADSGAGSLRQTIIDTPSGPISFSRAISGSAITLTSGELLLDKSLTIDASLFGADHIAIDGGGTHRIFQIPSNELDVTLDGLTLTNGRASGSAPDDTGGAILLNLGAQLTINQCTISGNDARAGAGICSNGGSLTVTNSTLAYNEASVGGGGIGNYNGSSLIIANSTFTENSAQAGGALDNSSDSSVTLHHTTFTGNRATGSGGGISNNNGSCSIENSIITANTAPSASDISGPFSGSNNFVGSGPPRLAPLGDYGGLTPTMPPLPGSPVIDAGGATSLSNDQRGYNRISGGIADLGAAEYRTSPDVQRFWHKDWDHDGQPFGLEYALGTDYLTGDAVSSARFAVHQAGNTFGVKFGFNPDAANHVAWVVKRSLALGSDPFVEVFRYDGPTGTTTTNMPVGITMTATHIELLDQSDPKPEKAFYIFEAVFRP